VLKVDDVRLDLVQELREGGFYVLIEKRVKEESHRVCLLEAKCPPHTPSLKALALFPPFSKGVFITIISVKYKDLVIFGQCPRQVICISFCST
jgi:hypothetical protein